MRQRTNQHAGRGQATLRHASHVLPLLVALGGCNSVKNGWLDPTVLGNFKESSTLEIRASLTLEDTPWGVPGAVLPTREDLIVDPVDYPISPGDTLAVEIHELRERGVPFQAQVFVTNTGFVNLPVVGRVEAAGLTPGELEDEFKSSLRGLDVLLDPQVTVNPLFLQFATYSIFGVGVSASNNAPLRAGTFPIRRPDLRVLEAVNQVGGLNEFVTDIYVFRHDEPAWKVARSSAAKSDAPPADETPSSGEAEVLEVDPGPDEPVVGNAVTSPETELLDAVLGEEPPEQKPRDVTDDKDDEDGAPAPKPGPMAPFIFVDRERGYVRNPAYAAAEGESPMAAAPLGMGTPAVNWERIAGNAGHRVIRVPADRLRVGDPEANVIIRGGDVIRIVTGEIGVYYVMGQVNRVGPFGFNSEQVTLKGAIAAAGGLTGLAWPDRCTVYRRIGQREQMIQVDLDRIFAGKDADFFVRRGDIINVGTHPFAPFLQAIRGATIPNPTTNVGYGFVYSRNFADVDSFSVRQNPHNAPDRFPSLLP